MENINENKIKAIEVLNAKGFEVAEINGDDTVLDFINLLSGTGLDLHKGVNVCLKSETVDNRDTILTAIFNAKDIDYDLMPKYCVSCHVELDDENNHSAGECNMCHEINKDD